MQTQLRMLSKDHAWRSPCLAQSTADLRRKRFVDGCMIEGNMRWDSRLEW